MNVVLEANVIRDAVDVILKIFAQIFAQKSGHRCADYGG